MRLRQSILRSLPHLSYHFHLSPESVWNMTQDEYNVYMDALREIQKEASKHD